MEAAAGASVRKRDRKYHGTLSRGGPGGAHCFYLFTRQQWEGLGNPSSGSHVPCTPLAFCGRKSTQPTNQPTNLSYPRTFRLRPSSPPLHNLSKSISPATRWKRQPPSGLAHPNLEDRRTEDGGRGWRTEICVGWRGWSLWVWAGPPRHRLGGRGGAAKVGGLAPLRLAGWAPRSAAF